MSKVNVAASRFRPAQWLAKAGFSPSVYMFRHLEHGQVLYSQVPKFEQKQIDEQFQRPHWANRKPSTRRDVWRLMCLATMPGHAAAVQLYQNLVRLRYMRDVAQARAAQALRRKNDAGQVWYSAQYRPTYAMEAVADLRECLRQGRRAGHVPPSGHVDLYWEDLWRMGDRAAHWDPPELGLAHVTHHVIPRTGNTAREQSALIRALTRPQSAAGPGPGPGTARPPNATQ